MAAAAAEDTPFGFGGAPVISGSVAAFKRRCEWFYVDPAGQEHGPVPFSKLASWYKKGHFPEDVKVGVDTGGAAWGCKRVSSKQWELGSSGVVQGVLIQKGWERMDVCTHCMRHTGRV
jgi:hypothetical protein